MQGHERHESREQIRARGGCRAKGGQRVSMRVEDVVNCRLVHRAGSHHTRIQFDLTKRAFVPGYILLQDGRQGFRLLRA